VNVTITKNLIQFTCPKCKQDILLSDNKYFCNYCKRSYPIINNIPDFISLEQEEKRTNIMRIAKAMDSISPIYESKIWYQLLLNLSGTQKTSLDSVANFYYETFKNTGGYILDVACGPATFGRRITSSNKIVFGIDISMGILQRGLKYIAKDGLSNVYLARSCVEELPFTNSFFDGVICSGSLHLFPDPILALREISRTMKAGATLAIQTFIAGKTIMNRLLKNKSYIHTFKIEELQQYTKEAGFEKFQSKLDGCVIIFTVNKVNNI